ncbi:lipid II:glycine glycyltransferase FemX [Agromyces ramosus]|uniref:lipid II:glycine glycyltransferase FemX n=1 Tax=Agromyces ramosus TaxID=33879 RepID=UPI0027D77B31|nr:peptidoglycan bridge formation glycyltransferase FemA/FemB family protein [Agromyces ramosus]
MRSVQSVAATTPTKPTPPTPAPRRQGVAAEWDDRVLSSHSRPHFMQSSTWERVRTAGPWHVVRREFGSGREHPALVFERHVEGVGVLEHVPRLSGLGPGDVEAFTDRVRAERGVAFASKVEVYQPRDEALIAAFAAAGWLPTRASQYRHAVVVEPAVGEERLLAAMKSRARAEIRAAERNGVVAGRVELSEENRSRMLDLMRETEERSGAFFRTGDYAERVWTAFADDDRGHLYFATHEGRVVAGAFVARFGPTAWYKDGGSLRDQPQLMASRLLQWSIMCDLAATGIERYDLGHVPSPSEPEAPGRGLLIFKRAFASEVVEYMPAFFLAHEPGADDWRRGERDFLADYHRRTGDYWY